MFVVFISFVVLIFGFALYKIKFLVYNFLQAKQTGKWKNNIDDFDGSIAFFHPFCNDCGGGEKVLWFFIHGIQMKWKKANIYIFTCDLTPAREIIQKVETRFNLTVNSDRIHFIVLNGKHWILPSTYKFLTLAGQSFGSMILGYQALTLFKPDIYIDTTGFSFIGCLFKLSGSKVVSYVHYPTISTDMISAVNQGRISYNNAGVIGKSYVLSRIKLLYYYIFSIFYWLSSLSIDFALVNSHWTYDHIKYLWVVPSDNLRIVYPPCSPHLFISDKSYPRQKIILSISQFRPEKNQKLQIDVLREIFRQKPEFKTENVKLVMVGSLRSSQDHAFMINLNKYSTEVGMQDYVEFKHDIPFSELKDLMARSLIGIHTMDREHFGIGIVELMAAGLITVAHNSGGPKQDIMEPYKQNLVGYLAVTVDEYAEKIMNILSMDNNSVGKIRVNAINSVEARFSDEQFMTDIVNVMKKLISDI